MERRFRELEQVLQGELAALDRLLHLAIQQKDVLIRNDREAFLRVIREQEEAVSEMGDLEAIRAERAARLAAAVGLPRTATLLELSSALGQQKGDRARELHSALSSAAVLLSELNRQNDMLVRQALEQTHHAVTLLRHQAEKGRNTYSPRNGQRVNVHSRAVVNCQA